MCVVQQKADKRMSTSGAATSDAVYHGIGLTFLAICPMLGASVYFGVPYSKLWVRLLNGYAGGLLFGFGLMHALNDGVGGIISDYPYPFMIAGTTTIFLYFLTELVEPVMRVWYDKMPISKELVNVNTYWCALLVHGCFEGLATGGLTGDIRWVIIGVLFPHKIIEYAAMTSTLIIADVSFYSWTFWTTLMTAEIPTMICFIVAWHAVYQDTNMSTDPYIPSDALFSCLCAGTFIYLALGHLIPEALGLGHNHVHDFTRPKISGEDVTLVESGMKNCCDPIVAESRSKEQDASEANPRGALVHKLLVYVAIALGWVTFALFALAPDSAPEEAVAQIDDTTMMPSFRR